MTRTARVIIASTRAATGVYTDRTGPIIVEWLNLLVRWAHLVVGIGRPALGCALVAACSSIAKSAACRTAEPSMSASRFMPEILPSFYSELRPATYNPRPHDATYRSGPG